MIHIDFETRSEVSVWDVGAWAYSCHPSTEVLCIAYARDDGEIFLENNPGAGMPLFGNGVFIAHNAFFERCIWENVLCKKYKWPFMPAQWQCSAAMAAAHALPRSLAGCAEALGLDVSKDMAGKRIMMKMSKPRKPTKNNPSKWFEDPKDFEKLYEYCKNDVEVERAIHKKLRGLNPTEQKVWVLDQTINVRGVPVDLPAVNSAINIIDQYSKKLINRVKVVSNGKLDGVSRREQVLRWIEKQGVTLPDYTKQTLKEVLKDTSLPANVREVLNIRLQLGKTSLKKLEAMVNSASADGRIRDTLMYHGASTGRWSGKIVQMQNLPKGSIKDTDDCIDIILQNDLSLMEMCYPDVMGAISSCIRGMIKAPKGHDLIVADFAAIEARVVLWLADDKLGLEFYKRGEDLYVDIARKIYNKQSIAPSERQLGKTVILGCLSEDAEIYSDIGKVSIRDLKKENKIWDGEKWVHFQQKIAVGKKDVIDLDGLELTLDHLIKTPYGWRTAAEIVLNRDTPHRPPGWFLADGRYQVKNLKKVQNVMSGYAAHAALLKVAELTNSGKEKLISVLNVLQVAVGKKEETRVNTLISYLITDCEKDGLPAGPILKNVVKTQKIKTSYGMVLEEFTYPSNRVESSWNTLLHLMGMTNGGLPSIELIITEDMKKETFVSLLKKLTTKTKKKECYDLVGLPDNCFQANHLIVHNCGYGMGPDKFFKTCLSWGVPITEQIAKRAVATYRETYAGVTKFWYACERAAIEAVRTGKIIHSGKLTWGVLDSFLFCRLPSGRCLAYPFPKLERKKTPWGEEKTVLTFMTTNATTKQWQRGHTYGGKLVENLTQATARDLMAEAMLRLENKGYPIILTVHDEVVAEVKEGQGSVKEFTKIMTELPSWAEGCPVEAEGWRGKRYRK